MKKYFFLEISRTKPSYFLTFLSLFKKEKRKKRTEGNKSCLVLACLNLASDRRLQPLRSEPKWLPSRGRPQLVPAAWQVTAFPQSLWESPPYPVNGSSIAAAKTSWASKDLLIFLASSNGITCSGQQRWQQKAPRALRRSRGQQQLAGEAYRLQPLMVTYLQPEEFSL